MSEEMGRRGDLIGRFVVLSELGRGGMGVVLSAYDPELDRRVALKILHPYRVESSEARQRLNREAKAMAKLRHPNAVTVYEVGTHEGEVFLAMEFVEGGSLQAWLAEPRSQDEIIAAFVAAGRGLEAAHEENMIHRDFKPENVLVGRGDRFQVTDFGLVGSSFELVGQVPELADTSLTQTGTVIGTPAYMSPEQHKGTKLDPRTDQFSFCVALWEALYGERPYPGRNLKELRNALIQGGKPTAPKGRRVPQWVHNILLRGLAIDPADRFDSMSELLDELDRDESDGEIGRRTRILLAGAMGTIWTIAPIVMAAVRSDMPTIRDAIASTTILGLVAFAAAIYARDSLGASMFNRQVRAIVYVVFGATFAVIIGALVADLSAHVLYQMFLLTWFVIAVMSVVLVERRLVLAALGYYAGFIMVAYDMRLLWVAMAMANAVLTINCIWIWRPRSGVLGRFRRRETRHRGIVAARTSSASMASRLNTGRADAVADTMVADP